jgi:hypothetical protein
MLTEPQSQFVAPPMRGPVTQALIFITPASVYWVARSWRASARLAVRRQRRVSTIPVGYTHFRMNLALFFLNRTPDPSGKRVAM